MSENAEAIRERWIKHSLTILEDGKGQLGIINYLRTQKLTPDEAKVASYIIFDGALSRLKRKQFPFWIAGWLLIFVGFFTPIAMYFTQRPVIVVSAAPVVLGFFLLAKLKNPTKLPQSKSSR